MQTKPVYTKHYTDMIALELQGRLGNQMFRYAYARVLMARRGDKDKVVISPTRWFNSAERTYLLTDNMIKI